MSSRLLVIAAVVGCHALAIWALQTGLLRRAVEIIVPVQVLADFVAPPQPQVEPAPTPPRPQPEPPRPRPAPLRVPAPAPQPVPPLPVTEAAPQAPIEVAAPAAPDPLPVPAASASSAPPSEAPPAPPVIVLPSSSAAYLNNPPPAYPPVSVRLNEQGTVHLRAYIGTDGKASRVTVVRSSGFPRLDQAAVETVHRWRFVPGTRNGLPEPMWAEMPIAFRLSPSP